LISSSNPNRNINIDTVKAQITKSWEITSQFGLEWGIEKFLLPVIKLHEKRTHPPWGDCHFPGLIVKLEDLITENGKRTNNLFTKIENAGGLHDYLDFSGKIVLSSIMPDKAIAGLPLEKHAEIINSLVPDYHITPDGETYLNEKALSDYEIKRMLKWTNYLIINCPEVTPIGLVKGSCLSQIDDHIDGLSDEGIELFAFHAGDYLFRSNNKSLQKAKLFYSEIRKKVPWLMVYGVGSDKYFRIFFDANCYATQSHFIQAFHGQEIDESGVTFDSNLESRDLIIKNLRSFEALMIGYKFNQLKGREGLSSEYYVQGVTYEMKYSVGGK